MYSMDVKVPLVPRSNASLAKGGTRSLCSFAGYRRSLISEGGLLGDEAV